MSDGNRVPYRTLLQSALALGGLPRLVPYFRRYLAGSLEHPELPIQLFPTVPPPGALCRYLAAFVSRSTSSPARSNGEPGDNFLTPPARLRARLMPSSGRDPNLVVVRKVPR